MIVLSGNDPFIGNDRYNVSNLVRYGIGPGHGAGMERKCNSVTV